jgi:hypothetical protein
MITRSRLILLLLTLLGGPAMAIEEPSYEVLLETKHYEVRRYQPYIVAEVDVDEDFKQSGNSAFRVLAGYIFGDNASQEKMNMTAPVESAANYGPYTYSFVMERKYTMESLPTPTNPDVRLVERPGRVMAVHRYSGTWSEERYAEHEKILLDALATDRIETLGSPVFARYNAPFTPWFLRRNEVMVEIDWSDPE